MILMMMTMMMMMMMMTMMVMINFQNQIKWFILCFKLFDKYETISLLQMHFSISFLI